MTKIEFLLWIKRDAKSTWFSAERFKSHEMTVKELAEISTKLTELSNAEYLERVRQGKHIVYRIKDQDVFIYLEKLQNRDYFGKVMRDVCRDLEIPTKYQNILSRHLILTGEAKKVPDTTQCIYYNSKFYTEQQAIVKKMKTKEKNTNRREGVRYKPCPFLNPDAYAKYIGLDKPMQIDSIYMGGIR